MRYLILVNVSLWILPNTDGFETRRPYVSFQGQTLQTKFYWSAAAAAWAGRHQWIEGFSVGARAGEAITATHHFFFLDDTLVFCEAESRQFRYLKLLLTIFDSSHYLRVHINLHKSVLYPVNDVANFQNLCMLQIISFFWMFDPVKTYFTWSNKKYISEKRN